MDCDSVSADLPRFPSWTMYLLFSDLARPSLYGLLIGMTLATPSDFYSRMSIRWVHGYDDGVFLPTISLL
jgi:hypothetical protein